VYFAERSANYTLVFPHSAKFK